MTRPSHRDELIVLSMIGGGLIVIVILIIVGLFGWFETKANVPLPNWAENVLVAIATAATLKLGDVLAALVTLATGRQVEKMGERLAASSPTDSKPPPEDAKEAADQMLEGAEETHEAIVG